MDRPGIQQDSAAWLFYVHLAFVVSAGLMFLGVYLLPVNLWIKGYFVMGLFFMMGSTVTLTKTLRDQHEMRKIVNRLNEVKTEKILNEYNLNS